SDLAVAFFLRILLGVASVSQLRADLAEQFLVVGIVERWRIEGRLWLADLLDQLLDTGDDLLDLSMRELESTGDRLFAHALRARFYHHDAVSRANDHDVQRALGELRVRWIQNVFAIHLSDANSADRTSPRNLRDRERCGGAVDGADIGIVFVVRRLDQRNDL